MPNRIITAILLCLGLIDQAFSQGFGNFPGLLPHAQNPYFEIPNNFSFQALVKAGDTLSSGEIMPPKNDFAGFISGNGFDPLNGYLMVNSEDSPGGATLFDIFFDNSIQRWTITAGKKIDFDDFYCDYGAGTINNCSGGITPWGTFVTCEEKSIDFGNCTYQNYPTFGWCIEIDPVTKKVRDYNQDGLSDKIWAFGRIQHENACFSEDQRTAYFGEDKLEPGFLFKFVADSAANLGSGNLFVLKLNADSTTGTWLPINNSSVLERISVIGQSLQLEATPFLRIEDVEIGPNGYVYFSSTQQGKIFKFKDLGNTIQLFETVAKPRNYTVFYDGGTAEEFFSWPDNLTFDPAGNLYVTQDGGNNHVWRFGQNHNETNPDVSIFINTPIGSEPTGINFSPDGNFLFLSIQHPSSNNLNIQYDISGKPIQFNKDITLVVGLTSSFGGQAQGLVPIANPTPKLIVMPLDKQLLFYPEQGAEQLGNWKITNTWGQSIQFQSFSIPGKPNVVGWDISYLPSGLYIVDFICNGKRQIKHFVLN